MTYTIHRQNKIITHTWLSIYGQPADWEAYHEGDEETNHRGYGKSEAEALADLERMDDEYSESCEEERSA